MTKVKFPAFIDEISGMMGDVVFKKSKLKGEAIAANPPKNTESRAKLRTQSGIG